MKSGIGMLNHGAFVKREIDESTALDFPGEAVSNDGVFNIEGAHMSRLIIALSAFAFLASAVPALAAPHDYVYKGHHYKHRKMSHGHWHYY